MPQSLLTGQLKEKPTYRVRCLYSSFVHDCVHNISAAGNSIRSQLGSPCHCNQYGTEKEGGTAHPSRTKSLLAVSLSSTQPDGQPGWTSPLVFGLIVRDAAQLVAHRLPVRQAWMRNPVRHPRGCFCHWADQQCGWIERSPGEHTVFTK